jgi:sterol desaturase/sphingolipid hydroxylase (fatty acid hydroxylase superfamily)
MIELLSDFCRALFAPIARNVLRVLAYPFNPGERIFLLYVTTSLLMAAAVWWCAARRQRQRGETSVTFKEFLFPQSIWRTASAWLDVRYFFFHQILRVFLYGTVALLVSDWTFKTAAGLFGGTPGSDPGMKGPFGWLVALGFGFVSVAVVDLVAWILHYCQHRFPILWEFHKVHHSARVMHPLTNYREHPVDNVVYVMGLGGCTGLVAAGVSAVLGYVPTEPTVLGVGIFVLAYNGLGYNLRHSHIWLKWPGPLVYMFGCPAHHQVHHSYHPTHINKNFAFMFPVWDVVFGTFQMPRTNADVKFGLGEHEEEEFTSCVELYVVPFRNVFRMLLAEPRSSILQASNPTDTADSSGCRTS